MTGTCFNLTFSNKLLMAGAVFLKSVNHILRSWFQIFFGIRDVISTDKKCVATCHSASVFLMLFSLRLMHSILDVRVFVPFSSKLKLVPRK